MKKIVHSLSIVFILLHASCAKVGAPDGGPKDTFPPKIVSSSPDSAAVSVRTQKITLLFDENIQTREMQKNLFISPTPKEEPKISTKGKGLEISFSEYLDTNKTYIFQFIEAISDLNEGNVLSQFDLSFSTGKEMDTFFIQGQVTHLSTGAPAEALVLLYPEETKDSILFLKPEYITKTDKQGNYKLKYLKKRRYRIVSFEDKNKNRLADADEPLYVSFTDPEKFSHQLTLSVPQLDISTLKLLEYGKSPVIGRYYLLFNQPIPKGLPLQIEYTSDNSNKRNVKPPFELSPKRDSLFFFPIFELDSLSIRFAFSDSVEFKIRIPYDTLKQIKANISRLIAPKQYSPYIRLQSQYPILKTNSREIQLTQDSSLFNIDSITIPDPFTIYIHSRFTIDHDYQLILTPGSLGYYLKNIENQTDTFKFSTRSFAQNSVGLNITHPDSTQSIIIELFNEQKTYSVLLLIGSTYFYDIEPGIYQIRAYTDLNKNQEHDGINYMTFQAAEPLLISSKVLEIKPEWDYENISISFVEEVVESGGKQEEK